MDKVDGERYEKMKMKNTWSLQKEVKESVIANQVRPDLIRVFERYFGGSWNKSYETRSSGS